MVENVEVDAAAGGGEDDDDDYDDNDGDDDGQQTPSGGCWGLYSYGTLMDRPYLSLKSAS